MRRPMRLLVLATAIGFVLLVSACSPGLPSGRPSISGTIQTLANAPGGATILVSGSGEVDKASVRITEATRIFVDAGSGAKPGTLADVVAGASVDVWFEGPVAESYPVQATAGTVLIRR